MKLLIPITTPACADKNHENWKSKVLKMQTHYMLLFMKLLIPYTRWQESREVEKQGAQDADLDLLSS